MVTPALPTRFEWLASATDRERARADERLQTVLGHLGEIGTEAARFGSDDPIEGIADAVREFRPDHILIALRGDQKAGWQEKGLLDGILQRFSLPVTAFVTDAE